MKELKPNLDLKVSITKDTMSLLGTLAMITLATKTLEKDKDFREFQKKRIFENLYSRSLLNAKFSK